MKGRLYDPKVGRFLTTDPIVSDPAFGQSWNPYSYVHNNPLAFTDPSGFQDAPPPSVFVYIEGPLTVMTYGPPTPQQAAEAQERANNEALRSSPVDLKATGNQAASPPQPTVEGRPRARHRRPMTMRTPISPGRTPGT